MLCGAEGQLGRSIPLLNKNLEINDELVSIVKPFINSSPIVIIPEFILLIA